MEDIKNGVAILLEDEESIIKSFQTLFKEFEIGLMLNICETPEKFEEDIKNTEIRNNLKVLIMDLSNTVEEVASQRYKAAKYIQNEYENNRIPIFIHSGNLHHYTDFNDKGTVFKIEKTKDSINSICEDIKQLKDSGFLDIFSNGGILEKAFMHEIHNAFVNQFKNAEIKEIITSIESVDCKDMKNRTVEIFQRIAVRCLYTNLISAKKSDTSIDEVKLNSIEHYYRRNLAFPYWTGDIFISKSESDSEMLVIITPRCNIGHENFKELIFCTILPIEDKLKSLFSKKEKGVEEFRKHITDDKKVGERFRFLPPSPQYNGGIVDFSLVKTLPSSELLNNYHYLISLSDELTNDVVRKYSSYMLRGGISETAFEESLYYLKA